MELWSWILNVFEHSPHVISNTNGRACMRSRITTYTQTHFFIMHREFGEKCMPEREKEREGGEMQKKWRSLMPYVQDVIHACIVLFCIFDFSFLFVAHLNIVWICVPRYMNIRQCRVECWFKTDLKLCIYKHS